MSVMARIAFDLGLTSDDEHLTPSIAGSTRPPSAVPQPLPIQAESVRELGLWLCLLTGAIVTGLTIFTPAVRGAVLRPTLHSEISTLAAIIALLFALLAGGRFRRTLMPGDLLLTGSLGVLGACNLLFSSIQNTTG